MPAIMIRIYSVGVWNSGCGGEEAKKVEGLEFTPLEFETINDLFFIKRQIYD